MTVVSWLREIAPCRAQAGPSGGLQEGRVSFQPSFGPPIERRRTTGVVETYECLLPMLSLAQFQAFHAWFTDTTKHGALRFCFRHPITDAVVVSRLVEPYSVTRSGSRRSISLQIMILPGTPWFAPYVRPGAAEVPAFVADYANAVYGIGSSTATAADMPGISGTYDLYTTSDSGVETFENDKVIAAGDIPSTKPAGIAKYVGFAP